MSVNAANTEQAAAWNGDDGRDWTDNEERYNASVRRHTRALFDRLTVADNFRVLDVGCGCGETTRLAAQKAHRGQALGIDLSAGMIARAADRAVAEGISNAHFVQGDAQIYPFQPPPYDLAISRYGAMFFGDPEAAFRNIASGLANGGGLAMLTWQGLDRNPWIQAIRNALAAGRTLPVPPPGGIGPFSLADVDRTTGLLNKAGFDDVAFAEIREPVNLGDSAEAAFAFVSQQGICRGLLQGLDAQAQDRALGALKEVFVRHETTDGVLLESGSWLVSAVRHHNA